MYQYKIYGLNVSSSRKIDILEETDFAKTDLTVNWTVSTPQTPNNAFDWEPVKSELLDKLTDVELWEAKNQDRKLTKVCFKLEEIKELSFVLDSRNENLSVFHHENMLESDLDSHFVGPVLSFTLRLRGIVCLHSSVVAVDGRAIAFPGHSTAGKSTIAAGMAEAGAEILADDIAVLFPENNRFLVQPGYSKVRLRPKAAAFLADDPGSLPIVYSYRESRYASLEKTGKFHPKPLPLAAIYVLGGVSDEFKIPFVKPIEAQDKLIQLIENTSGSYVIMGASRAKEFKVLAKIAKTIPMRKLFYAHEIETLPAQCKIILEDIRQILKNS